MTQYNYILERLKVIAGVLIVSSGSGVVISSLILYERSMYIKFKHIHYLLVVLTSSRWEGACGMSIQLHYLGGDGSIWRDVCSPDVFWHARIAAKQ